MAEVMKYEDFKEGGSESAVKVSTPSSLSPNNVFLFLEDLLFNGEKSQVMWIW